MIKVVYDTNVIVAGLLNEEGIPALLLDLVTQRRVRLFLSKPLLEEYEVVLKRPKFGFAPGRIKKFIALLKSRGAVVNPKMTYSGTLHDPSDNRILECAVEGKVDYIVTGNIRHFPFKTFKKVHIVSPTQFWEIYKEREIAESR